MLLPVDQEMRDRVRRLELPFNDDGFDPFGVSRAHLEVFFTALSFFYTKYFRVRAYGVENIPARGRAMIVCNHSGGVAVDGAMILASCFLEMQPPRLAQGMADKFLNRWPFASLWTSRVGQLTGLPEHAARLLRDDRLLMVFPEGARGTAKLYGERFSLVGFGTGFLRLALATNTPIVPTAFIGGGDVIPTVANLEGLGRLVGAPYVPITPWLLPLPIPLPCQVYYGEPLRFAGDGDEDDEAIERKVDEVKRRIASLIALGRARRESGRLDQPFVDPSAGALGSAP